MRHFTNILRTTTAALAGAGFLLGAAACGGGEMEEPAEPQEMVSEHDDFPNPFTAEAMWGDLPGDRTWGAVSAIYPAADGNIWAAERCGGQLLR